MKISLLTFGLMAIANLCCSQSFFVKFGGGYSFPPAAYPLGSNYSDVDWMETDPETGNYVPHIIRSQEEVRGAYNTGAVSVVSMGYLFPSNMGVEVNMGYVFGRQYSLSDEHRDFLDGQLLNESISKTTWKSRNPYVAPSFILTTGERVLRPYVSVGVVLALPSVTRTYESRSDFEADAGTSIRKEKYSKGLTVGPRGAAGVDFALSEKICVFTEVTFISMNFNPRERETIQYEVNGEDFLPTLSMTQKKTRFVKRADYDSRVHANSPEPSNEIREPSESFGMSSVAVHAGLKILL